MIDRNTGDVVLRDGTRLGRELTRDAFVWTSPLYRTALRSQGAGRWTSWTLEAELERGGRFYISLRFEDDPLRRIELSLPWEGVPFFADPAWKVAHDRYLLDVLGSTPPFEFPWGRVDSVADDRGGDCLILIRYAEPADRGRSDQAQREA